MDRKSIKAYILDACCRLAMVFLVSLLWTPGASHATSGFQTQGVSAAYGELPLTFVPNQGQFDGPAFFALQGKDKSIFFTQEGLTFLLTKQAAQAPSHLLARLDELGPVDAAAVPTSQGWALRLDFIDARPDAKPEPLEKAETVFSYFRGRPTDWIGGVQACSSIIYRELWPGVDLVFSGTTSRMKHDFIVRPGADPASIRLAWRGADSVRITAGGEMEISTPLGAFQDEVPVAWQDVDGRRVEVLAAYALNESAGVQLAALGGFSGGQRTAGTDLTHSYGFELGAYDPSRPLTLDPAVLVYSGFLGSNQNDWGSGVAVDRSGCAYVTGYTHSAGTGFPVAVGPDTTLKGDYYDAFVAKLNRTGTALVYCGFIGGSNHDTGKSVAVDSTGAAYITGDTKSSTSGDFPFPATVGPDLTYGGQGDAFVAKVNTAGTALEYCGYIGDISSEDGNSIAVDRQGQAYVTGWTFSSNFPKSVGPDLSYNSNGDAFVAKVAADGSSFVYSGYIGDSGLEQGEDIVVDSQGQAYVAGWTDGGLFPPDSSSPIGEDYFIAKVSADGSSLTYGVLSGLAGNDRAKAIALDEQGQVYVVGYQGTNENTRDAFVQKHDAAGSVVGNYGGTIGGASSETANGIALAPQGQAVVIGTTNSTNFPVVDSDGDCSAMAGKNAFLVKLNSAGNDYVQCGCLGGSGDDFGMDVAVDRFGNAFVVGGTRSSDFPTKKGPVLDYKGFDDVFVARIGAWGMWNPALMQLLLE